MSESWKRLIDGLLERRLVTRRGLEDVLRRMRPRPETVEAVLVDSGLISKAQLLALKAELYDAETIDLADLRVQPEIALLLPQQMAERYTAVCVGREQNTLILAATEPLDAVAVDYLRMRSGYEVKVVLTYAGDLAEIRRRIYVQRPPEAGWRPPDEALRRPITLETVGPSPVRRIQLPLETPKAEAPDGEPEPPPRVTARSVPAPEPEQATGGAQGPRLRPVWKPDAPPMREPMRVPLKEPGCRLCKASLALDKGLDENALLEKILLEGMTEVDAESASLLLVDAEARHLFFKAATGMGKDEIVDCIVPLDEDSVARWVLEHNEPTIVGDARRTPQHNKETDRLLGFSTRNFVAVPVRWGDHVVGVVEALNRRHGHFGVRDIETLQVVSAQLAAALHIHGTDSRMRDLVMESIELAVEVMQSYGTVSRSHLVNVAQMASAMGREVGLSALEQEHLVHAGMLHDIGLAGAREEDEQEHARRGVAILERIPTLRPILPIVGYHHERWNGSGPFGLEEEDIPLLARILAVAEEWCETRPWENSLQAAYLQAFLERFGTDFDPGLYDAFLAALETTAPYPPPGE